MQYTQRWGIRRKSTLKEPKEWSRTVVDKEKGNGKDRGYRQYSQLRRPITNTGPRKPKVSGVVNESGSLFHFQGRHLESWA